MKRYERKRIAALALLLVLCAGLLAGCGSEKIAGYALEKNEGRNAVSYPYIVRTKSATWYLSKADMELLGREAYLEGFRKILENQQADFADAQEALRGYLPEEVPPVDIYTDFCGKAEESRYEGGYYYGDGRGIRLFTGWDTAGVCLLHEYVHYLSFTCAQSPASAGFWGEALAEYVSTFVCENRMLRAENCGLNAEGLQFYLTRGAGDPETGELDMRRFMIGTAEMIGSPAFVGQTYLAVSSNFMVMTEQRQSHPTMSSLSYYEAASMMDWLIETCGRDTVFGHWDIDSGGMADIYGKSFAELYADWRVWNLERCDELGLDLTIEG